MKTKHFILSALAILAVGCTNDEPAAPATEEAAGRQLTLTASMPSGEAKTRLALAETDGGNISVKWKEGDKISLCFVKGETVKTLHDIAVTNIREGGIKADFSFTLPAGITYPFDLYGVYGATLAADSKTVTFPAVPAVAKSLDDAAPMCVMRFEAKNLAEGTPVSVGFLHLGSLIGVWLTNASASAYTLTSLSLMGDAGYKWLYNASGQATCDITDLTFSDKKEGITLTYPLGGGVAIGADETVKLYRWMVPTNTPDVSKTITATLNSVAMPALPAKAFAAGSYCRLKLIWTGTQWKRFILPPASDLVAHWPMDGNANDVSGNNHHGTVLGGVTPTADHKGNANRAYLFDGANGSYIDVGDWVNGGAMTIAFWARWDAYKSFSKLLDFGNGVSSDNIYIMNYGTGSTFEFGVFDNSSQSYMYGGGFTIPLSTWVCYAITIEAGGKAKIYTNGVFTSNKTLHVPRSILRTGQFIGGSNWSNGEFKGAIDDLRIYNRALTYDEVTSLYYSTL
ncbi:LamG domain-containing protein [Bacteroides heparinolyticus]|uniref:LamG domain-containing protein n=2 Tax=Prevotella heparinolytica TaxID=28113 RepID=UPI0035A1BC69